MASTQKRDKSWIKKKKKIYKKAFNNKNDAIKYRKELEDKYFKPILEKYK